MGNVISVLHYGVRSDTAEAPRESEVETQTRHGGDESENRTVDMVNDDEQTPKREDESNDGEPNETSREEEMEQFRKELATKREARRKIIAERTNEMKNLQKQLAAERCIREKAVTENSMLRSLIAEHNIDVSELEVRYQSQSGTIVGDLQAEMAEMEETNSALRQQNVCLRTELSESHCAVQSAKSDNALLNKEIFESRRQIKALKEMVDVSKKMLAIRENQLMQLKDKLLEIEKSFADRETAILSDDLRTEYEKQLLNIRNLRILYEERARVAEVTRRNLTRQLEDQKLITAVETNKNEGLSKQIDELQKEIQEKQDTISSKDDQLGTCITETKGLQLEMAGINKLFTHMLLGFNKNQDLDKLVNRLEEHHDLLRDMAVKEHCSDSASALPKLLMDLVSQVENEDKDSEDEDTSESIKGSTSSKRLTSSQEIIGNLPKVWRVLMELLSHQNSSTDVNAEDGEKSDSCYKSVQTPTGPCLVPSVSKTYIRLKDLILEKKSLQKEMTKMKQLNSHLENRLQDQERRLCLVSSELTKTWHVVGRLRRHHQQLHTHEKILRYELQQKRKLVTEIREELEYCREKWDMARQKNVDTEVEWQKLRKEFAGRKQRPRDDSVNTSAESGFSDEKQSDDEDSRSSNICDREEKLHSLRKNLPRLENHPESTTDHNPMAEGEDPISDMVDVTDLPLDDQGNESEDNTNAILSESEDQVDSEDISVADTGPKFKSKVKHKSQIKTSKSTKNDVQVASKPCSNIETELNLDCNIADTVDDKPQDNTSTNKLDKISEDNGNVTSTTDENLQVNGNKEIHMLDDVSTENMNGNIPLAVTENIILGDSPGLSQMASNMSSNLISPQQIMENIRLQNERLALRDQRMQKLETSCNNLTRQVKEANNRGTLLTKRVELLSNKSKSPLNSNPQNDGNQKDSCESTSERSTDNNSNTLESETKMVTINCEELTEGFNINSVINNNKTNEENDENKEISNSLKSIHENNVSTIEIPSTSQENNLISPAQILENIRMQNERLAKRDLKLKSMENECESIVNEMITTNERGEALTQQLTKIHSHQAEKESTSKLKEEPVIAETSSQKETKKDTSDYEARLIAKEERLKRLEDQAKSLVSKVNNTKTKRVKIDYKLQELHNIYGVSDDQSTSTESPASNSSNRNESTDKRDKKNAKNKEDPAPPE